MKRSLLIFFSYFITIMSTLAQQSAITPLYKNGVPNSIKIPADYKEETITEQNVVKVKMVTDPTITSFFPDKSKATGTAIVICPGGAYSFLAIEHEGYEVAKKFSEQGIAAFVLKYRLPSNKIMANKSIGPLQDAQTAIKLIRQKASEWNINPSKIGIMGFSAGGHLASTAGTHFDKPVIENVDSVSLRPDFMVLAYPVISFGKFAHKGSRSNLIGRDTSQALVDYYSNEKQVTANTPITFIMQTQDDKTVPVENSLFFYEALLKAGVKVEMHLYQNGGHGFGLNNKNSKDYWFDSCINWLKQNNF